MNLANIIQTSALIVVDVQNDFLPGGSLAIQGGDTIIGPLNRIAPAFSYVVATRDWHPAGHVSFASSYPGKKPFDTAALSGVDGVFKILWPDHCVQGTPGADFHPGLDTRPFSAVIHKGYGPLMDSYSVFFQNDRKTPSGLEFLLRGLGYSRVFLCGLATDVCVLYSALDAVQLGFDTYLVKDASKGLSESSVREALNRLEAAGVRILSSKEITL
jgi:nicotinamidase/pyrazinamidase